VFPQMSEICWGNYIKRHQVTACIKTVTRLKRTKGLISSITIPIPLISLLLERSATILGVTHKMFNFVGNKTPHLKKNDLA
jgi:hypothetical protein